MGLIIDITLVVLVAGVAITQLLIPVVTGSRLFPAFSRQSLELVDELAQVEQELEAEHLRQTLALKKQQLTKEHDVTLHI